MSPGTVISLCDRTGHMVQPWLEAGYDAITVDLQEEVNPHRKRRHIVGDVRMFADFAKITNAKIMFAFPPCTDLAVSGARWFRSKGLDGLNEALQIVNACKRICERMHRQRPEHVFQKKVMDFLNENGRPEFFWFAVPNGDLRNINVALRLKAEGVRPGVADICIMLDRVTAWLELKAPKGRLRDEQIGFGKRCERLGHRWACVRSMCETAAVLDDWGVLRPALDQLWRADT